MTGRIIQIICGVIISVCSTSLGMAKEHIPENVRADFFAATEVGDVENRQTLLSYEDMALLPSLESLEQTEETVDSEKQEKRGNKRNPSPAKLLSKCRFTMALSPKMWTKGVARHPQTQDARQERTAAIRFLQLASLVC